MLGSEAVLVIPGKSSWPKGRGLVASQILVDAARLRA